MCRTSVSLSHPRWLSSDAAHPRSPPPRTSLDPKVKNLPRKSANLSGKGSQEARGQSRKSSTSPNCHEQEGGQEQWEKAGGEGGRGRCRSAWKPVREVLNVDNVLSELEQRRQSQHDGKVPSQERAEEELQDRRESVRMREERKQMCLMTIYEDEQRHESESHSSLESDVRLSQQRAGKLRSGPKTLLRSDTWTIQRTESGYESSDRLSSGSTNPDSPGVDGLVVREQRSAAEAQQHR